MKTYKTEEVYEGIILLREPVVRKNLGGIAKTTLWRWVREGHFPKPVRLGGRCVAWRSDDIDQWINSRTRYDEDKE